MPAHEKLNDIQFTYEDPESLGSKHSHRLRAQRGGETLGMMAWDRKQVLNVDVLPEHQRQGVATALWNEGHRLAGEHQRIPQPKHSPDRTNKGDAWARSVGGRLPRQRIFRATIGEPEPA